MPCLALVLEFHHPLPAPGRSVGADWAEACAEAFWPILRAIDAFVERAGEASITIAVSPSWTALASDPRGRVLVRKAVESRVREDEDRRTLLRFYTEAGDGDALLLMRRWAAAGAVELIPTTATHTWLPSIACEPVLVRAQVGLAAADHARRFGGHAAGIWLPFLAYPVGLESVLAEHGLRYFGTTAGSFVRGTATPSTGLLAPMITPAGVAAFAVSPSTTLPAVDPHYGYGLDPRYGESASAPRAALDHARHFIERWAGMAEAVDEDEAPDEVLSIAHLTAQDLARSWPHGGCDLWLGMLLEQLAGGGTARASSLNRYLARNPVGPVGRPGPIAGGLLAARPAGSDLFERCRSAADLAAFAVDRRANLDPRQREVAAGMLRSLLRAQQLDWTYPSHGAIEPEEGLKRAEQHLADFYAQAADLLAGRSPASRSAKGPRFLPDLDLEDAAGG